MGEAVAVEGRGRPEDGVDGVRQRERRHGTGAVGRRLILIVERREIIVRGGERKWFANAVVAAIIVIDVIDVIMVAVVAVDVVVVGHESRAIGRRAIVSALGVRETSPGHGRQGVRSAEIAPGVVVVVARQAASSEAVVILAAVAGAAHDGNSADFSLVLVHAFSLIHADFLYGVGQLAVCQLAEAIAGQVGIGGFGITPMAVRPAVADEGAHVTDNLVTVDADLLALDI